MSQFFALDAQKAGFEHHVHAEADGLGIVVYTDEEVRRVGSVNEAIRIARDYIGAFLQPAQRGGIPWGLLVTVSEGRAAYGEWPLAGRPRRPELPADAARPHPQALARLRPALGARERHRDRPGLRILVEPGHPPSGVAAKHNPGAYECQESSSP